ncbi:MAG: hypothetical protein R3E01_22040 [Pirellulaceae bacterium]
MSLFEAITHDLAARESGYPPVFLTNDLIIDVLVVSSAIAFTVYLLCFCPRQPAPFSPPTFWSNVWGSLSCVGVFFILSYFAGDLILRVWEFYHATRS